MFRLGLTSYAYYWATKTAPPGPPSPLDAWGLLERAASMNLEVVQFCENLPLLGWSTADLRRLKDRACHQDIIIEVGARGLDVEQLRGWLQVTHILGAHLLRISPWSGLEHQARGVSADGLREAVRQLLPDCHRYDVTLAIENYFDLPDQELARIVRQIDDERAAICLDTANSTGLLNKPLETAQWLAPHVVSLHLKDFAVLKPVMGYRIVGVPLGQGWLDAQSVLDLFEQNGRQPNVLLEMWVDPEETREDTLRKEHDWVCQSVTYARDQLGIKHATHQKLTGENKQ